MRKLKSIAACGVLIGALFTGIAIYHIAMFEITGKAFSDVRGRGYPRDSVKREDSPSRFRAVVKTEWVMGGLGLTLSLVSYIIYRAREKKS